MTGLTSDFALIVRPAEAMRLLVYRDPTDGIEYVGSLSGQDFSLAGGFNRGELVPSRLRERWARRDHVERARFGAFLG